MELLKPYFGSFLHFPRTHESETDMKRVTGIGGIFFHSPDPAALRDWYKAHLGIDVQDWGGTAFTWTDSEGKPTAGTTIWNGTYVKKSARKSAGLPRDCSSIGARR